MIRLSAQKLQKDLVVWQSYVDSRATWFHLEGLGHLLLRLGHPDSLCTFPAYRPHLYFSIIPMQVRFLQRETGYI